MRANLSLCSCAVLFVHTCACACVRAFQLACVLRVGVYSLACGEGDLVFAILLISVVRHRRKFFMFERMRSPQGSGLQEVRSPQLCG